METKMEVYYIRVDGVYLNLENENITATVKLTKRNDFIINIFYIQDFIFSKLGNLNYEYFEDVGKIYNILEKGDKDLHFEVNFKNGARYEHKNSYWKKTL